MGKAKRGPGSSSGGSGSTGAAGFSTIDVDPLRVRYAHSKIKPMFSGCGRTIEQTLGEIRDGQILPSDLPAITVLLGPADPVDGGPCYFSLNNRRLFVFKACREEGLLGPEGLIRVRARAMKPHERERYTLDRCSLQAKFLFMPKPSSSARSPETTEDTQRQRLKVGEAEETTEQNPLGTELRQSRDMSSYDFLRRKEPSALMAGLKISESCPLQAVEVSADTEGTTTSRGGKGRGRIDRIEGAEKFGVAASGGISDGEGAKGNMSRKLERSRKGRRRKAGTEGVET